MLCGFIENRYLCSANIFEINSTVIIVWNTRETDDIYLGDQTPLNKTNAETDIILMQLPISEKRL